MAKRLGTDKDVQRLLNAAEKQGWKVEITRGNHIKCIPPDKSKDIIIGALTGHTTSNRKFKALLVKAGLQA